MSVPPPSESAPREDFAAAFTAALASQGAAVTVAETHISWVFLTGDLAYKIKKPVTTPFLDFSTLDRRRHFCEEELRLDRRFAPELYLDVVPIYHINGRLQLGRAGQSQPAAEICEYAVRMRRFPAGDLLTERLAAGRVTSADMGAVAARLAEFHQRAAAAAANSPWGSVQQIRQEAVDNLSALQDMSGESNLAGLSKWTEQTWEDLQPVFQQRKAQGSIRECHGDLHAGNIVWWQAAFVPFDGIEFNDSFRWIDVISDAGFLVMDLLAEGHRALAAAFLNAYLEASGDYHSLRVLRWYLVYRALVRAKVARIARQQHPADSQAAQAAHRDLMAHLQLAQRLTERPMVGLYIMHGLSGSGKTTVAQRLVEQHNAIRLRSDVERKRLAGLEATHRPEPADQPSLYSADMSARTYEHLRQLSRVVLQAGFSAVVDATFLQRQPRQQFADLAHELHVPFHIVHCQADVATLCQRLAARQAHGGDASDADQAVLQQQLSAQQELQADERAYVMSPDQVAPREEPK